MFCVWCCGSEIIRCTSHGDSRMDLDGGEEVKGEKGSACAWVCAQRILRHAARVMKQGRLAPAQSPGREGSLETSWPQWPTIGMLEDPLPIQPRRLVV